jgi:hypothetical protein
MTPQRIDLDIPLYANIDEFGYLTSLCIEIRGNEIEILNLTDLQKQQVQEQIEMEVDIEELINSKEDDDSKYDDWREYNNSFK